MTPSLYYNTVTPLLREILDKLMRAPELSLFRLVGGTSLSLRLGHRESVDIDMFTEQDYGTIDWRAIYELLRREFAYADNRIQEDGLHSFGESFYLGESEFKRVKVDLFYTDPFLQPAEQIDGIRMAALEDIVAMKVDVVLRGGRKKDFWDLHELKQNYTIGQMLDLHRQRYPWTHERETIIRNFTSFQLADEDFDPNCLRGKYWEFIKMDFVNWLQEYKLISPKQGKKQQMKFIRCFLQPLGADRSGNGPAGSTVNIGLFMKSGKK